MFSKKITTREIALMGVLMALQLILTRFLSIQTPFVRIGFSFIPTALMAMTFGPMLTGVGSLLSDFVGISLFPVTGPYFPGFSFSTFLTGVIYGWFFYKKELTWSRIIVANLLVTIIVDIFLNTLWLYMMMGPIAIAQLPLRVGKNIIQFPIKVFIMYFLGHNVVLQKQLTRFAK
ncbi:folate family ECF transporter S component [Vagococcus intermedius]|uniref:Folate family ECF transporter S component n=1 Tax=Vagococcus intermedius TaxID=2991418 RepID=A0AAF0I7N4_9ENTE|nr:folate family ECF transporter S component [Vagococcus intermedius]WEG73454.1 folate family ECF transporter S component [Vagococcus intermedius]WEG75537.1 folate family ECF transporter S component [Vagococcus intermedius]